MLKEVPMEAKREINKRKMVGKVIKDKMDKTVVVEVEKFLKHPKYHKFIKRKLRYKAHDENNSSKTGDRVLIVETRPLSKDKRWLVKEVVRHEELFVAKSEVAHDSGEI
jgi:small subunit ribosomal protein S17